MNYQKSIYIVAIYFALLTSGTFAQNNLMFNGHRHIIGFISGYGGQYGLNVPYDYKVYFLQAQYSYSLIRKHTFSFEILCQPQFNLTDYRLVNDIDNRSNGFEYGLNVAILFRKNTVNDNLGLYLFIGSGPHYVSGTPQRQSDGFIFSDNLFIGLSIKLDNDLYLDIRPGFRHISNAGLQNPNGGVNTAIFSGGIFYTF